MKPSKFISSDSLVLHTNDSLEAWETLNETFLYGVHKNLLTKGHSQYLYDLVLFIDNPDMDRNIDIFKYFHYSINKWNQLIGNYLDISSLKKFKSTLPNSGEFVKTYSFTNSHDNGKSCLLNMVCSRRVDKSLCLTFFLRASEVTKRLLIDLVFFQRLGEYLFDGEYFNISIHFNYVFQDDPVLLMYTVHKPDILEKLNRGIKDPSLLKQANRYKFILDMFKRLKNARNLGEIKYKIYRRILKVINPALDTSPNKPLRVKELRLDKYLNV